jgi:hypothetical protein
MCGILEVYDTIFSPKKTLKSRSGFQWVTEYGLKDNKPFQPATGNLSQDPLL